MGVVAEEAVAVELVFAALEASTEPPLEFSRALPLACGEGEAGMILAIPSAAS